MFLPEPASTADECKQCHNSLSLSHYEDTKGRIVRDAKILVFCELVLGSVEKYLFVLSVIRSDVKKTQIDS